MSSKQIHLLALALLLCGTVAAIGDKITPLPFLPPWVAQCWFLICGFAGIANAVLHILYAPSIAQAQSVLAAATSPPVGTPDALKGPKA